VWNTPGCPAYVATIAWKVHEMAASTEKSITALLFCLLILSAHTRSVVAFENPKAKAAPKAKPHRRSAAEGFPPLPLPATPLRRTEKKRPPAPPALVGMVHFPGRNLEIVAGQRTPVQIFPTTPVDIAPLMRYASSKLKTRYRHTVTSLKKFSWDPTELPLLYITGWTEMPRLPDMAIGQLRRYLYDGGTLFVDAQCGRKEFINTARREIARIFPNRQLALLDSDSELYSSYFRISEMRIRVDDKAFISRPPLLEALYLGCRPAIILSPIDLNCGWDIVNNPIAGGILYHQGDALRLGTNIITATLANLPYGRSWGTRRSFHQQERDTRDQLVVGQILHQGDWDPTPHALPNLMKYVRHTTTLNVQSKRIPVSPATDELFDYPVLYMTGLRDFTLSEAEVIALRDYLAGGGMIVADAAAGRKAFDQAFRREIRRVLPNAPLQQLPLDNAVYQWPHEIQRVVYSDAVTEANANVGPPALEAITLERQLAVVYSAMSFSNGWEELTFAYNRGYSDADALRLGVNIFCYALTH